MRNRNKVSIFWDTLYSHETQNNKPIKPRRSFTTKIQSLVNQWFSLMSFTNFINLLVYQRNDCRSWGPIYVNTLNPTLATDHYPSPLSPQLHHVTRPHCHCWELLCQLILSLLSSGCHYKMRTVITTQICVSVSLLFFLMPYNSAQGRYLTMHDTLSRFYR